MNPFEDTRSTKIDKFGLIKRHQESYASYTSKNAHIVQDK